MRLLCLRGSLIAEKHVQGRLRQPAKHPEKPATKITAWQVQKGSTCEWSHTLGSKHNRSERICIHKFNQIHLAYLV